MEEHIPASTTIVEEFRFSISLQHICQKSFSGYRRGWRAFLNPFQSKTRLEFRDFHNLGNEPERITLKSHTNMCKLFRTPSEGRSDSLNLQFRWTGQNPVQTKEGQVSPHYPHCEAPKFPSISRRNELGKPQVS